MLRRLAPIISLLLVLFLWSRSVSWAEEIVFNLDWVPYGRDAGIFAAKAEGFLKAEGLSVKFLKGKGSADSVKRLEVGNADYGVPDAGVVFLSRAKDTKLKLLAAYHDKSPQALFFLEDSGIKTLKDLEGKSMGDAPWSSAHRIFRAVAAKNNLNMESIKFVPMDPGVVSSSLLAGKVDFILLYTMNLPILQAGAEKAGEKLHMWLFADYGVDTYGNAFATTDTRIKEKPDQVRRFVRGMIKGVAWAVENPGKAVDFLLKEHPTLNRDIALKQWKIAIDHLMTATAAKKGIGYLDRRKIEFTRDTIFKAFKVNARIPTEDLYTDEFLPAVLPKKG